MLLEEKIKKVKEIRLMLMTLFTFGAITPVFAAGDLLESLTTKAQGIYNKLVPFIIVIAVISLVICALFYFTSKDPRKADEAFQWGKRILLGAIVVAIAPKLLIEVIKLFGDGMTGASLDELEGIVK